MYLFNPPALCHRREKTCGFKGPARDGEKVPASVRCYTRAGKNLRLQVGCSSGWGQNSASARCPVPPLPDAAQCPPLTLSPVPPGAAPAGTNKKSCLEWAG